MGDNEKLKITVEGEDKASPVVTSTFGKVKQAAKGVMGSFTELNSAIQIGEKIWNGFNKVLDATVGETVDYAKEVRDLSRLIGATPEEASKLIQAADDVNISVESMTSALQAAIRKGVEPTIEGIGDLADEYNEIQDPIEKSKFLMDKFGRSGADLGALMEKGSAGIREMGEEAEMLGLVLDQEGVQKARDYEIAMDNLGDAMMGIKIEIGNELIPKLTEAGNTLGLLLTWNDRVVGSLDAHEEQMRSTAATYEDYIAEMERAAKAAGYQVDAEGNLIKVGMTSGGVHKTLIETSYALSEAAWEVRDATDDRRESIEKLNAENVELVDSDEDVKEAEEALKESMQELATYMRGDLGKENQDYDDKLNDLQGELDETKGKIQELSQLEHLTDEQRSDLDELKSKENDIQAEMKETADAHEEKTKRILWDMLQQQLAVNDLTTQEATALGNVAESWGLIDEDTRIAWQSIQDYIGGLGGAKLDADALMRAVQGIPDHKMVTVDIFQNYFQNPGEWQYDLLGFASGGHFTVPPGYPNDSFPIGVSSGEEVDVAPAGGGGGGGLTFILNYSPMVSTVDRNELELRLKPVIEGVVRKYR